MKGIFPFPLYVFFILGLISCNQSGDGPYNSDIPIQSGVARSVDQSMEIDTLIDPLSELKKASEYMQDTGFQDTMRLRNLHIYYDQATIEPIRHVGMLHYDIPLKSHRIFKYGQFLSGSDLTKLRKCKRLLSVYYVEHPFNNQIHDVRFDGVFEHWAFNSIFEAYSAYGVLFQHCAGKSDLYSTFCRYQLQWLYFGVAKNNLFIYYGKTHPKFIYPGLFKALGCFNYQSGDDYLEQFR